MRIERSGGLEVEKGPSSATRQHLPPTEQREAITKRSVFLWIISNMRKIINIQVHEDIKEWGNGGGKMTEQCNKTALATS